MTRIASKFGIAAALTLGMLSTAAAQVRTTNPTTTVGVSKGEVVTKVDTVIQTVTRVDTVRMFRTDTLRLTGPTVTRWDTVTVTEVPGWLTAGRGGYFGLGAGAFYPSASLGSGQIPGYAFQANMGYDMAGPLGVRLTAGVARPDESPATGAAGARPTIINVTGDLKLNLPMFNSSRFPQFGLYAVAGGAYIRAQDVRYKSDAGPTVLEAGYHDSWGYNVGGGATLGIGHKRQLFLEARAINYNADPALKGAHQMPVILGINWY